MFPFCLVGRKVLWGKLFEKSFPHTPFKNFPKGQFLSMNNGERFCSPILFGEQIFCAESALPKLGDVQAMLYSVYPDGYDKQKISAQTKTSSHTNVGTGVLDGPRANDFCLVMVRRTILLYAIDFLSVTDRRGRRSLQVCG